MSALAVYESLPEGVRAEIEQRVLARVGASHWGDAPADAADALTLPDALGGDDDHPALREELRAWWLERANTDEILARIAAADERARELAIVLCAEACAHLTDDSRVAECHRVRLAWVRGEATDEQRKASLSFASAVARTPANNVTEIVASDAARSAAKEDVSDAARFAACTLVEVNAAWDASNVTSWAAAWNVAMNAVWEVFAAPLRSLYPEPWAIQVGVGLANWDTAVANARATLRKAKQR